MTNIQWLKSLSDSDFKLATAMIADLLKLRRVKKDEAITMVRELLKDDK